MALDIDKEAVQVTVVICGTVIAVGALLFDGELGNAMGMGIMSLAASVVGYLFGVKSCSGGGEVDAEEIQVDDRS